MARPIRKTVPANLLNKRVEVWGKTRVENELGEIEFKDVKLKTVYAGIIPQAGSMGDRVGTEFASMTHKVLIRYGIGKDIKTSYHFIYNNRRYDILYPLNPYESNELIEFFVKEVYE